MKKALVLAVAALICLTGEAGCSKSDSSQESLVSSTVSSLSSQSDLPSLKGSKLSEQIRSDLTSSGWTIRDVSPQNLGIFQTVQPTALFTARNGQNQLAFLSWFDTIEQAETCYQDLLPDDSSVQEEKGANYSQAVVTMPDQGGLWVFRQVGGNVFGLWTLDAAQKDALVAVLDSFQAAE